MEKKLVALVPFGVVGKTIELDGILERVYKTGCSKWSSSKAAALLDAEAYC
jgi:hypothetical protein